MPIITTLDTTGLDLFIACPPRVAKARLDEAELIAVEWAEGVRDAEKSSVDAPAGRVDEDMAIRADDIDENSSAAYVDVSWAIVREYGGEHDPGDGGQLRQATEAHREEFFAAVAAALVG